MVDRVHGRVAPESEALAAAVARNVNKLMACKDECEVARLLTGPEIARQVAATLPDASAVLVPTPPAATAGLGLDRKISFGLCGRPLLRLMARLKGLRGTAFDPFGRAVVRRRQRELIGWYEGMAEELLRGLTPDTLSEAAITSAPEGIRGYEELKLRSAAPVEADVDARLKRVKAKQAT